MVTCQTPRDLIGDSDCAKPIPPLPDEFLTWPGKEHGNPKPSIFFVKYFSEPVVIVATKITDRIA